MVWRGIFVDAIIGPIGVTVGVSGTAASYCELLVSAKLPWFEEPGRHDYCYITILTSY